MCSNVQVRRGRFLALDYGTKNVGLACSDELGVTVRPLPSLPNRNLRDLITRLKAAIAENRIEGLVVGIPCHMNGTSGTSAQRVEKFIHRLSMELDLPVGSVDERLSTVEAKEVWNTMNARQQRKYRTIDSLAAAFILQRFLREE